RSAAAADEVFAAHDVETAGTVQRRRVDGCTPARTFAEQHIVPVDAADNEIVEAVAVDVAGRRATPEKTAEVNSEAARTVERRQVEAWRGRPILLAEQDIVRVECTADDQVAQPIAVDVAGRGDGPGAVSLDDAGNLESIRSVERTQVDGRRKAAV